MGITHGEPSEQGQKRTEEEDSKGVEHQVFGFQVVPKTKEGEVRAHIMTVSGRRCKLECVCAINP